MTAVAGQVFQKKAMSRRIFASRMAQGARSLLEGFPAALLAICALLFAFFSFHSVIGKL